MIPIYITPLKTIIIEALRETFDDIYPNVQFRNVNVELDYPVENQSYPAIFVSYDDSGPLKRAGISMVEHIDPEDNETIVSPFARWRFEGNISLTVCSIVTAAERDKLYDEMIGVVAFGREDPNLVGRFHTYLENNDLIASILQTDVMTPRGSSVSSGTPWNTSENIFERTVDLQIIGEFVPDMAHHDIVPLSQLIITPSADIGGELFPDDPISVPRHI